VELAFCLEHHLFLLLVSCPRVLHNPVFCVSRILCNPALRVSRIFCNLAFCVSNMTRTSFFLLHVVNLANPINPANMICPTICAAVWANPGNLANPANPICLPVRVAVLANPVNLVVVTRIFYLACGLCSNTCHPRVAQPNHTCSLQVPLVLRFWSRHFALIFMNRLTNTSSIDMNLI
jgi:hypothetical protein